LAHIFQLVFVVNRTFSVKVTLLYMYFALQVTLIFMRQFVNRNCDAT